MTSGSTATAWGAPFAELAGRRVLITGASRGIGAAVAAAFAQCGARVAIHYGRGREEAGQLAQSLRTAGHAADALGADLAEPAAGARLVEQAAGLMGGIDILINNAGNPMGRAPVEEFTEARFAAILQLNLASVAATIAATAPLMRAQGRGAIINTTSVAARNGGGRGVFLYAAAKGGVEALTRGLAKDLAGAGIRVNCVAPGYIDTEIHAGFSDARDLQTYVEATPLKRAGLVQDCVGTFLFLACEATAGFITGQTIGINGGLAFA